MSSSRIAYLASTTALALTLAACQSTPLYPADPYRGGGGHVGTVPSRAPANMLEYGYVTDIQALQNTHRGSTGAGILLGAVVGGLAANHVGGGSGRTAATIAGAVGGAVAGNAIEGRMNNGGAQGQVYGYRITIRVDNGQYRVYDVSDPGGLRINDRVQVQNGQIARIQ
ncbi:hypothetical protein CK623_05570 [Vandammella animalimorsus]|uniref:Glycine zipper 2TM domain-containing protein n=1 Tax=Vandammella animalimorsus TaxID=2029117 RepID=A0A2A2AS81_9BURK|nr:glycine zipper 2TM domain-containing protein [Vandammella animalimorsus]PAT38366.1 hypothetical protein CK625_02430 [Vandammella animalimorsus]PAT40552.1 hypothetical protein CK623_05570 [Vandammella animalimorsus]